MMLTFASMLLAADPASPTTTVAPASKGGSLISFLPLVLIAGVFLFMRQRRQVRKPVVEPIVVGDRVQSVGGIRGTVVDVEGDEVRVEVAPGVVMTFVDQAVRHAPAPPAATTQLDDVIDEPLVIPDDVSPLERGEHGEPHDHEGHDHEGHDHDGREHGGHDHPGHDEHGRGPGDGGA